MGFAAVDGQGEEFAFGEGSRGFIGHFGGSHGEGQGLLDGLVEGDEPGLRDFVGTPRGVDTGLEERFGGVDVAQPHYRLLLHQKEFDGLGRGFRGLDEMVRGEFVGEGLGAEVSKQIGFFVIFVESDAAEGAGIVQDDGPAVVEGEPGADGGGAETGIGEDGEVARHLQMDAEEAAGVQAEEEVLAAAIDGGDAAADGTLAAGHRGGAELAASGDGVVEMGSAESGGDGLHFGEFGHLPDLQFDRGSDGDAEFLCC